MSSKFVHHRAIYSALHTLSSAPLLPARPLLDTVVALKRCLFSLDVLEMPFSLVTQIPELLSWHMDSGPHEPSSLRSLRDDLYGVSHQCIDLVVMKHIGAHLARTLDSPFTPSSSASISLVACVVLPALAALGRGDSAVFDPVSEVLAAALHECAVADADAAPTSPSPAAAFLSDVLSARTLMALTASSVDAQSPLSTLELPRSVASTLVSSTQRDPLGPRAGLSWLALSVGPLVGTLRRRLVEHLQALSCGSRRAVVVPAALLLPAVESEALYTRASRSSNDPLELLILPSGAILSRSHYTRFAEADAVPVIPFEDIGAPLLALAARLRSYDTLFDLVAAHLEGSADAAEDHHCAHPIAGVEDIGKDPTGSESAAPHASFTDAVMSRWRQRVSIPAIFRPYLTSHAPGNGFLPSLLTGFSAAGRSDGLVFRSSYDDGIGLSRVDLVNARNLGAVYSAYQAALRGKSPLLNSLVSGTQKPGDCMTISGAEAFANCFDSTPTAACVTTAAIARQEQLGSAQVNKVAGVGIVSQGLFDEARLPHSNAAAHPFPSQRSQKTSRWSTADAMSALSSLGLSVCTDFAAWRSALRAVQVVSSHCSSLSLHCQLLHRLCCSVYLCREYACSSADASLLSSGVDRLRREHRVAVVRAQWRELYDEIICTVLRSVVFRTASRLKSLLLQQNSASRTAPNSGAPHVRGRRSRNNRSAAASHVASPFLSDKLMQCIHALKIPLGIIEELLSGSPIVYSGWFSGFKTFVDAVYSRVCGDAIEDLSKPDDQCAFITQSPLPVQSEACDEDIISTFVDTIKALPSYPLSHPAAVRAMASDGFEFVLLWSSRLIGSEIIVGAPVAASTEDVKYLDQCASIDDLLASSSSQNCDHERLQKTASTPVKLTITAVRPSIIQGSVYVVATLSRSLQTASPRALEPTFSVILSWLPSSELPWPEAAITASSPVDSGAVDVEECMTLEIETRNAASITNKLSIAAKSVFLCRSCETVQDNQYAGVLCIQHLSYPASLQIRETKGKISAQLAGYFLERAIWPAKDYSKTGYSAAQPGDAVTPFVFETPSALHQCRPVSAPAALQFARRHMYC